MSEQVELDAGKDSISHQPATDSLPGADNIGEESSPAEINDDLPEMLEKPDGEAETREIAEEPLPLDQVFEILRNQRRRYVLRYLYDREHESVRLGELAEQIAAWENGKSTREITSGERKRVYVGLYQCHLPKMDSMNVISFNKPRGIIEPGARMDSFEDYLDRDTDSGPNWYKYYLGLSLLGGTTIFIGIAGEQMMALPIMNVGLGLIVLSFITCSIANVWHVRNHE